MEQMSYFSGYERYRFGIDRYFKLFNSTPQAIRDAYAHIGQ